MFNNLLYGCLWGGRNFFHLGGIFMGIFFIAMAGILIALFFINIRRNRTLFQEEPIKILKTRLAKGEIDKKEFDELKNKLS
jgi:uncharacterized membrane protein